MLALVALFLLTLSAQAEGRFGWNCRETSKNGMQCQFDDATSAAAEVCFDVVKICTDGHHKAPLCSGRLQPGDSELKVVASFDPKIHILTRCLGTEFQNKVTQ